MAREHLLLEGSEDTIHLTEEKPLSKKEKRQNWWYYHKIHLLIGLVAVLIGGYFVYNVVYRPIWKIVEPHNLPPSDRVGCHSYV